MGLWCGGGCGGVVGVVGLVGVVGVVGGGGGGGGGVVGVWCGGGVVWWGWWGAVTRAWGCFHGMHVCLHPALDHASVLNAEHL